MPDVGSTLESSNKRLLLEAVLELPVLSTPANNGLGIFPFRDAVPGLENPGKQQSARWNKREEPQGVSREEPGHLETLG